MRLGKKHSCKLFGFFSVCLFLSITVEATPVILSQPSNQAAPYGGTAIFTVATLGTNKLTYGWLFNATNLPPPTLATNNGIITTVAGNGPPTYNGSVGNGRKATNAPLLGPSDIALDAAGNIFIADSFNNLVRKVDTNGIITSVAGNTTLVTGNLGSYSGDGGLATYATLNIPNGIALDNIGNLYIADSDNNRIREVATNGFITTIAGNGTNGYSGDGGAATNASLSLPNCLTIDLAGNLLISDSGNNRIRKIDTTGIITTIAGTVTNGYSGDGGPATNARLNFPKKTAFDAAGNLFIADVDNNRIRKIDTNGIITTVAGNGRKGYSGDNTNATKASLTSPESVIVDNSGNLYIADTGTNRIRKVDANGIITTIAGNGNPAFWNDGALATSGELNWPNSLKLDSNGNLLICDYGNERIRKVTPFQFPTLTLNNVFNNNGGNYQVVISDGSGSVTSSVASLTVVPSIITQQPQSQFASTNGTAAFAVTAIGQLLGYQWYFSNPALQTPAGAAAQIAGGSITAVLVTNGGSGYTTVPFVQLIGGDGDGAGAVAVTNNGMVTAINVTNGGSGYTVAPTVQIDPPTGLVAGQTNAVFNVSPVATNNAGNYYVVISNFFGSVTSSLASLTLAAPPAVVSSPVNQAVLAGNTAVFAVSPTGVGPFTYQWLLNGTNLPPIITTIAGKNTTAYNPPISGDGGPATNAILSCPQGLAVDNAGNLYYADQNGNCVRRVDTNGVINTIAFANAPDGISLDAAGNLFIAEMGANQIYKRDSIDLITTVAGTGTNGFSGDYGFATNAMLSVPHDVTVDGAGNVFIADFNNNRVRKVDINGVITTLAGNGLATFSGDGGLATSASLYSPSGVYPDGAGNLYIVDYQNNRIRRVDTNGIISTFAGKGTHGFFGDGGQATNAYLASPYFVVADQNKNVFIMDHDNYRVRKVAANGIITTVLGNGTNLYAGDGGPATRASISDPRGITVDNSGNLYIAEFGSHHIRKVQSSTPSLTLNNATTNTMGNYSVIVTGPGGSVTSSVASLVVFIPPQNFTATANVAGVTLQLNGTTNYPYVLQTATNLTPPVAWLPVVTNPADATGFWTFTDTNSGQYPQRFYRATVP